METLLKQIAKEISRLMQIFRIAYKDCFKMVLFAEKLPAAKPNDIILQV